MRILPSYRLYELIITVFVNKIVLQPPAMRYKLQSSETLSLNFCKKPGTLPLCVFMFLHQLFLFAAAVMM